MPGTERSSGLIDARVETCLIGDRVVKGRSRDRLVLPLRLLNVHIAQVRGMLTSTCARQVGTSVGCTSVGCTSVGCTVLLYLSWLCPGSALALPGPGSPWPWLSLLLTLPHFSCFSLFLSFSVSQFLRSVTRRVGKSGTEKRCGVKAERVTGNG